MDRVWSVLLALAALNSVAVGGLAAAKLAGPEAGRAGMAARPRPAGWYGLVANQPADHQVLVALAASADEDDA